MVQGQLKQARELFVRSVATSDEVGDVVSSGVANCLMTQGLLVCGETERAYALAGATLQVAHHAPVTVLPLCLPPIHPYRQARNCWSCPATRPLPCAYTISDFPFPRNATSCGKGLDQAVKCLRSSEVRCEAPRDCTAARRAAKGCQA
jgi:hypothetical protein